MLLLARRVHLMARHHGSVNTLPKKLGVPDGSQAARPGHTITINQAPWG